MATTLSGVPRSAQYHESDTHTVCAQKSERAASENSRIAKIQKALGLFGKEKTA